MLRKAGMVLVVCVLVASPVVGQEWARKMFKETTHDFGTVARGAKAEYRFEFSNIYLEDVHVAAVRSSCGCTSVHIEKEALKTYEKGAIVATLNTGSFQGQRGARSPSPSTGPSTPKCSCTIAPSSAATSCWSRAACNWEPSSRAHRPRRKIALTCHGRSDWKIQDVKSTTRHYGRGGRDQPRRRTGVL